MMNRKLLFAAIALLVLMGLKYAFGQEDGAGITWDPSFEGSSPDTCVFGVMKLAPIVGMVIGVVKALTQNSRRPILEPIRLK
jgi:hypothetical protein